MKHIIIAIMAVILASCGSETSFMDCELSQTWEEAYTTKYQHNIAPDDQAHIYETGFNKDGNPIWIALTGEERDNVIDEIVIPKLEAKTGMRFKNQDIDIYYDHWCFEYNNEGKRIAVKMNLQRCILPFYKANWETFVGYEWPKANAEKFIDSGKHWGREVDWTDQLPVDWEQLGYEQ